MFSGVIEAVGIIASIASHPDGAQVEIYAPDFGRDMAIGDTVAVDGEKLVIARFSRGSFTADITSDAADHTTLGELTTGQHVNLERSLRIVDRLNGHQFMGVSDGIGVLEQHIQSGPTTTFVFRIPFALTDYLMEGAPLAVAGISLTVARLQDDLLSCQVVPAIKDTTTLHELPIGAPVNIEIDPIAKYLKKFTE